MTAAPTIRGFLDFWASPQAPKPETDPAARLVAAYWQASEELRAARAETLRYLVPLNNGKAWQPGFAPDSIDEVAALAVKIKAADERLKSICQDIEAFVEIAGAPTMRAINEGISTAKGAIDRAAYSATAATRLAMVRAPRDDPAENIKVKQAYELLKTMQAENEPIMEELRARAGRLHEITGRYEAIA